MRCLNHDEGRSVDVSAQTQISNHGKRRRSRVVVVSVAGKDGVTLRRVRLKKTNTSEPLRGVGGVSSDSGIDSLRQLITLFPVIIRTGEWADIQHTFILLALFHNMNAGMGVLYVCIIASSSVPSCPNISETVVPYSHSTAGIVFMPTPLMF